jgi:hypothetical protein
MVLLFNGFGFCPFLISVCFVVVLDRFDIEIYAIFLGIYALCLIALN